MILVTGTITLDPAKADEARAVFNTVMEATHKEDGCHTYRFSPDLNEPGVFHLTEQWENSGCIDSHMQSSHLAEMMQAMGTLGVTSATIWQHQVESSSKMM